MADEYVISVVLEGNASSLTSATNQGAKSQRNLKKNTDDANLAFLAQVARYQAMTAALNQTIGGINKIATGMEAIGWENQAEWIRKNVKYLEGLAGIAEIYLAYLTLTIALGKKDVKTKSLQTIATGALAKATAALNYVMGLNPMIRIAMAVVLLVVALVALQKKFDLVGKSVEFMSDALGMVQDAINGLLQAIENVSGPIQDFLDIITGVPITRFITGEGG